ncbi:hypothetical protein SDJN02_13928, partial [Cucurbita argyrosperma subsp. argyrosperma]
MAASISTSPYPLLTSERSNRFAVNDSSSSRLFFSSSLQLPVQLRCVRLGNCGISAPSRSRIFPVEGAVAAGEEISLRKYGNGNQCLRQEFWVW